MNSTPSDKLPVSKKPLKPLGPPQPHRFEQDPGKFYNACRFCGLEYGNPIHQGDDTL